MTPYAAKKKEVLAALRPLRREARLQGIFFYPQSFYRDFLTLSIGVDHTLPEDERRKRRAGFSPKIVAALESAGLRIDRSAWNPAEGRAFAVLY